MPHRLAPEYGRLRAISCSISSFHASSRGEGECIRGANKRINISLLQAGIKPQTREK